MELLDVLRRQAGRYQCPTCGKSLADCRLDLVSEADLAVVVRITCAHCEATRLVVVQAASVIPDPDPVLDQPLTADPAITADDVLDVRLALAGYGGDLKTLFGQRN